MGRVGIAAVLAGLTVAGSGWRGRLHIVAIMADLICCPQQKAHPGLLMGVMLDLQLKLLIAPKVLMMANLLEITIHCWMRWSLG